MSEEFLGVDSQPQPNLGEVINLDVNQEISLEVHQSQGFDLATRESLVDPRLIKRLGFGGFVPIVIGVQDGPFQREHPLLITDRQWPKEQFKQPGHPLGYLLSEVPTKYNLRRIVSAGIISNFQYPIGGQYNHRDIGYPVNGSPSHVFDICLWVSRKHGLHLELTSRLPLENNSGIKTALAARFKRAAS